MGHNDGLRQSFDQVALGSDCYVSNERNSITRPDQPLMTGATISEVIPETEQRCPRRSSLIRA